MANHPSIHSTGISSLKLIVPGVIGNVLEWFDFSLYGYFSPIIARLTLVELFDTTIRYAAVSLSYNLAKRTSLNNYKK